MKCEDLKQLLESNDEENARIKANTMKCFEQVKDFVIDDLIQKSIESNFQKQGQYLRGYKIYEKIFEVNGISTNFIIDMYLFGFGWEDYYRITDPSVFKWLDSDQQSEYTKNRLSIKTFFSEFDRSLFRSLIESHVKSCGFKEVTAEAISGRKFKTGAFYASRSTIEKACCPDAKTSRIEVGQEKNEGIICAVVVLVIILMALGFLFI